jgi:hypothetical protein
VTAVHVANRVSGADVYMLSLEGEGNIPTWFTTVQFFLVGVGALLIAWASERSRLAWAVTGLAFLFLSMDEAAQLHEKLVEVATDDPDADLWYWPALYAPVLIGTALALWHVLGDVRRELESSTLVVVAVTFLAVSVLLDAGASEWRSNAWVFEPGVVVEEGLEFAGTALLISIAAAILLRRVPQRLAPTGA